MKRALSRFGAPSVRGLDCFDPSPLGHQRTRPRAAGAHRSLTKYSGRWCRDHPTTDCRESRGAHLPSELACRKQVSTSLSAPQSYHTEECRRHAVAAGSAPLSPLGQKFSLWSSSGSEAQGQRLRQCETQVWLARWFLVPASRAQPLPLGRPLWWQWPGWKAIVRSLPCPGVAYTMQNRGMRGRLKYLPALGPARLRPGNASARTLRDGDHRFALQVFDLDHASRLSWRRLHWDFLLRRLGLSRRRPLLIVGKHEESNFRRRSV